ncbi:hypothetical protein D3C81_1928450 [compost metagenome]
MSLCRAPTAKRTPISRTRSFTDTSMMFITPTPPTIKATAAMADTSAAMVWLDFITALRIWSAL